MKIKIKLILIAVGVLVLAILYYTTNSTAVEEMIRRLRRQKVDLEIDQLKDRLEKADDETKKKVKEIDADTERKLRKAADADPRAIKQFWDDLLNG